MTAQALQAFPEEGLFLLTGKCRFMPGEDTHVFLQQIFLADGPDEKRPHCGIRGDIHTGQLLCGLCIGTGYIRQSL
ncbi:hypothetical protein D3C72_2481960 [compost metagenome]